MKNRILLEIGMFLLALAILPSVFGAASFSVTSFSCTPSEVVVSNLFSCTSQVKNDGDAAGSVNMAYLYPDASNWLESSYYTQSSGTTVNPGESTEITFTGLRATKSGSNGFLKIMLDDVSDTYVSDYEINVINIVLSVNNPVSSGATMGASFFASSGLVVNNSVVSAAMGNSFSSSVEVTAGGSVDVSLTFTVNSGGCSIGSQPSSKTITGMLEGNKASRTWTVTQGTAGDCVYTITAVATGEGGIATTTDSASSTVTCTDCPTDSGGTTTTSGGGGGGSASGSGLGEIIGDKSFDLDLYENVNFNVSGAEHTITLKNLTETYAVITIKSSVQTFTIKVGEEIKVDLDSDGVADIILKLTSTNTITNTAVFTISKISSGVPSSQSDGSIPTGSSASDSEQRSEIGNIIASKKTVFWLVVLILAIILIIIAVLIIRHYRVVKHIRGY